MNTERLHSLLSSVSGHLSTGNLRESAKLQELHRSLSRSLFSEDVQQLKTWLASNESQSGLFPC